MSKVIIEFLKDLLPVKDTEGTYLAVYMESMKFTSFSPMAL